MWTLQTRIEAKLTIADPKVTITVPKVIPLRLKLLNINVSIPLVLGGSVVAAYRH